MNKVVNIIRFFGAIFLSGPVGGRLGRPNGRPWIRFLSWLNVSYQSWLSVSIKRVVDDDWFEQVDYGQRLDGPTGWLVKSRVRGRPFFLHLSGQASFLPLFFSSLLLSRFLFVRGTKKKQPQKHTHTHTHARAHTNRTYLSLGAIGRPRLILHDNTRFCSFFIFRRGRFSDTTGKKKKSRNDRRGSPRWFRRPIGRSKVVGVFTAIINTAAPHNHQRRGGEREEEKKRPRGITIIMEAFEQVFEAFARPR